MFNITKSKTLVTYLILVVCLLAAATMAQDPPAPDTKTCVLK